VEDTILEVCEKCLRYGEAIAEPVQISVTRKKQIMPLPSVEEENVIVDNYGKLIIEARKKKNLTREEFAKKIKERESVIRRVEREEMEPNDVLTEKLERFLEIKLKKPYEESRIEKKQMKGELTLGDIAEIK